MAKHTSVTDSRPPPHGIRTSNPNVVQTRIRNTQHRPASHGEGLDREGPEKVTVNGAQDPH